MKELDREELREITSDEELSRRIREEVVRMQQERSEKSDEEEGEEGAEDEDAEGVEGEEDDELEEEGDQSEGESQRAQRPNFIKLLFTGNILVISGFAKYYGQMVVIAALFLLSIIVMFWSLHLDMEHNALTRDVQLLRERSVRLQEVRYSRSSHSAIVEELERRGIDIGDSKRPATVIKKSGLW